MNALPSALALAAALVVAPATWRAFSQGGFTRANYRDRELPFPFGVVVVFAALLALVPLALVARFADTRALPGDLALVVPYALGVAFLGLADDVLSGSERGWRGHGAQILRGGFSTGALKAAGAPGLAPYVVGGGAGRDGGGGA